MAGVLVVCEWYGQFVADVWVWFVCGWFGLFVGGFVCVCVGGADSSGVLVSKSSILSYQQYIIFVSKQEVF